MGYYMSDLLLDGGWLTIPQAYKILEHLGLADNPRTGHVCIHVDGECVFGDPVMTTKP